MQGVKDKNSSLSYIVCPECQGIGKNKLGFNCPNCAGVGLSAYSQDRFFYWEPKLGLAVIKLNHLKRSLHLLLNVVAFAVGLVGFLSIFWWFYSYGQISIETVAMDFWYRRHWLLLIFWIGIMTDLFIVYRINQDHQAWKKIEKILAYSNKDPKAPNNWKELKTAGNRHKADVSSYLNYSAFKIVEEAYQLAYKMRFQKADPIHLFYALLKDQEVQSLFSRLGAYGPDIAEKIKRQFINISPTTHKLEISNEFKQVLVESFIQAREFGQEHVHPMNMILPIMNYDKVVAEVLYDFNIDGIKVENVIKWFRNNDRLVDNYKLYRKMARYKPNSSMDRAYTAVATPILNHYSHDLTLAAKWGRLDFCVEREKEIENIFHIFTSGKNGVLITGEPGVGKKTLVSGIAEMMVQENVPHFLKDKRLLELDLSRLISGAHASESQERMLVIIDEVFRAGNIILFIQNIESICGITAGGEESMDLSEVLARGLEKGALHCLATVDPISYTKYLENTPLSHVMAKFELPEPTGNLAIQIIESKIGILESKYHVFFSYNAISQAVDLSSRYMHEKFLPVKAIEILELAASKLAAQKSDNKIVNKEMIAEVISDITHIPLTAVTDAEGDKLIHLEERMHEHMVNQEEAVHAVAASLRRARTSLRENKRPIASFLFLGPTGVGKTELAKTIARVYFGREDYMVRLDMSEYQAGDSLIKMIGSPNGTLGYLTEAVRKQPFSLVLLDEFEKAHPDILNLFLQVMDDGRLTDGQGRTIDFTNCILIATSNCGALYIQEQIQSGLADMEKIKQTIINDYLNKAMRPELINRFDGLIVFKPLTEEDLVQIVKLMLHSVESMLEEKGIGLRTEPAGLAVLAKEGFDPKFGARPLRRLIQDKIENEIANLILAGKLKRRDVVVIDGAGMVGVDQGREL